MIYFPRSVVRDLLFNMFPAVLLHNLLVNLRYQAEMHYSSVYCRP